MSPEDTLSSHFTCTGFNYDVIIIKYFILIMMPFILIMMPVQLNIYFNYDAGTIEGWTYSEENM